MSYSLQNTTSLTSLADAIRAKSGETEQMTVEEMITAVNSITTGGGSSSVGEVNIPRLQYWNYYGQSNGMIAALFDRLTFNLINSTLSNAFQNSTNFTNFPVDWRNKTINIQEGSAPLNLQYFVYSEANIKYLPKIVVSSIDMKDISMQNAFYASRLVKIDNDAIPQNLIANVSMSQNSCCGYCQYLREVPENFMANNVYISTSFPGQNGRSMCHHMYDNSILLKQVIGAPIFGQTTLTGTANRFDNMFNNNNALHHLTFYMPNGAVGVMNAINQTIDLSNGIGYFSSPITTSILDRLEDEDRANVIIISAANNNATVANMQNLNSLAEGLEYATYNRQSAIETINSLPDTTAAIAAKGGTNTIKFKSGAGSAYGELYNMSNLTEEEIAVATAKGWTVQLV